MQTASGLPIRKRIRLQGFHYSSQCAYYVTICAREKHELFGRCENDAVMLNEEGLIVRDEWIRTFAIRKDVTGDQFVVMPNHLHALIALWRTPPPQDLDLPHRRELSRIVGGFKAAVTSRIRSLRGDPTLVVWQSRFHDRVVRNHDEYERIAAYIADNPRRWCARRSG